MKQKTSMYLDDPDREAVERVGNYYRISSDTDETSPGIVYKSVQGRGPRGQASRARNSALEANLSHEASISLTAQIHKGCVARFRSVKNRERKKGDRGMGKRPGAKYVAVQRLNALMANEITHAAIVTIRTMHEASLITFPDGRIHTFEMRNYGQNVVMDFLTWCCDFRDVRDHVRIDTCADELISLFLSERMAEGQRAWILQAKRSVLRLYFQNQKLAESVELR